MRHLHQDPGATRYFQGEIKRHEDRVRSRQQNAGSPERRKEIDDQTALYSALGVIIAALAIKGRERILRTLDTMSETAALTYDYPHQYSDPFSFRQFYPYNPNYPDNRVVNNDDNQRQ